MLHPSTCGKPDTQFSNYIIDISEFPYHESCSIMTPGKTTTALLLVRAWVFSNKRPVLCAADSNIAVDNLVDGCAKAHLHVVRVGRPEATRMDLEQYNLLEMVKLDRNRPIGPIIHHNVQYRIVPVKMIRDENI